MTKRTKQQISKEIKRLVEKRKKEYNKVNSKYVKALDNLYLAEDREQRKNPEKFRSIYTQYEKKRKKVRAQWNKALDPISKRYEKKLAELYSEYGPVSSLNY